MKLANSRGIRIVISTTLLLLMASEASATEAAMGRYIPGLFGFPTVGVLPPEAGFYWQSSNLYYSGKASSSLRIPIGGSVHFGAKADIALTNLTGIWVPDVDLEKSLTLGLGVTLPIQYMDISASIGPFGTEDHRTSLGDVMFAPMLGWHSGTHFLTASLRVFAPTGEYEKGALANNGLNYWTFSPNLAYTYIDAENKIDYSLAVGIDYNTKNSATNYKSGALAHVDATVTKSFDNGLGVGVLGSVLYQMEADKGGIADELGGFKGRSFAIGPVLTYSAGSKEHPVNMSLSWAPEFGVENRMRGNAVYLNLSGSF